MSKPTVLFLCKHNAGRSQLGAALLQHLAGDRYTADSAGFAPADLFFNPHGHAGSYPTGYDP